MLPSLTIFKGKSPPPTSGCNSDIKPEGKRNMKRKDSRKRKKGNCTVAGILLLLGVLLGVFLSAHFGALLCIHHSIHLSPSSASSSAPSSPPILAKGKRARGRKRKERPAILIEEPEIVDLTVLIEEKQPEDSNGWEDDM